MIKVVLWDIDGTLLNFRYAQYYSILDCFMHFHLGECTEEMIRRYSEINQLYWCRLERGEISKKEVLNGRFETFFKEYGIESPDLEEFNALYQDLLGRYAAYNEGGRETVEKLKGKVSQYAVTNGTKNAQIRKLKGSGLDQLLDGVFISEDIGIEKPGVGFFDAIWPVIGPYDKSEIMIVGDSLTSDMLGGNHAGIVCCWYNPEGKERMPGLRLDYEISHLGEVCSIIKA